MKSILIIILAIFLGDGDAITKTSRANKAKEEAESAFTTKNYDEAIKAYNYLLDSLLIKDENASLNLAHSYFLKNDTIQALNKYNNLTLSANREIKSIAHQQLGVISEKQEEYKNALTQFKNALKANPQNKDARYNYELVKKKLQQQEQNKDQNKDDKKDQEKEKDKKEEEKKEDQKDQKDKDSKEDQQKDQKKDDQNKEGQKDKKEGDKGKDEEKKENENNKGEEKKEDKKDEKGEDGKPKPEEDKDKKEEGKESTPEEKKKQEEEAKKQAQSQRFEQVEMSEEKAKMILNAMKQSEKQYLQQLKKQPTQKRDTDKPDW